MELSTKVIVTAEDPRRESLDDIFGSIARGCKQAGGRLNSNYFREDDRKKAIKMAISGAKRGDFVMLLGKGHEKTMNIGGVEHKWDEAKTAKKIVGK